MHRYLAGIVVAAACGSKAPPAATATPTTTPAPATSPMIVAIDAALVEQPTNALLLNLRATMAPAEAVPFLERMDALGWDVPLLARDFAPLRDDPKFQAIAASIAKRAPRVARSEVAFTLAEIDLIPEGIAVDPRMETFYVGSLRKRTVLAIDGAGAVKTFADASDGLLAVVGMKVDATRDLLWVTSWKSTSHEGAAEAAATSRSENQGEVVAFKIADGTVTRRVRFPDKAEHLPNDLAIAEDGTVYLTDSTGGGVWRAAPGADVLAPVVPAGELQYPNGLALAPGGALHVADSLGLVRVELASGAVARLEAAPGVLLGGIDGLVRDGDRLLAVQNGLGEGRVVALALDAGGTRVTALTVLENDPAALALATTTVLAKGALYTVANAQLDAISPDGIVAGYKLTPSRILRTPLP